MMERKLLDRDGEVSDRMGQCG